MNKKVIIIPTAILTALLCIGFLTACGSDNTPSVAVHDQSVEAVETAPAGSTEEISGKYAVDGIAGNYYLFGEDGKGIIQQDGTYQNAETTIDLKYANSDTGTKYQKEETKDGVKLTTMIDGAKQQNEVDCVFVDGEDKLMSADSFNAIYKFAGFDDSRMVFYSDGDFDYVQDFTYEIKDDQISITQNNSKVTYTWKIKKDKVLLKSGDTVIMKMIPAKAKTEE